MSPTHLRMLVGIALPIALGLSLSATPAACGAVAAGTWPRIGPQPSPAGAQLLRDEVQLGVRGPEWILRFRLAELDEPGEAQGSDPDATSRVTRLRALRIQGLATDQRVNDKTPDATCSGCGFRPLSQSETSIAVDGLSLIASWNNTRGFCAGTAVQGYGWSANGGLTWTDAGDPPALAGGGRYRGDPLAAVNRKTGRFYVGGLYEGGVSGSGVAALRGHFAGGAFVIDDNRQLAVGGADFIDKEWMAVDSLSGNVYFSWTNFQSAGGNQVEFARFDADLNSLGAIQVLSSPAANGNVQGSRPCMGPDGVLYVVWYEYGWPQSSMKIRRSDDFGASFGPEATVATFYENSYNGAPGYRRGFAPTLPGIACDVSNGPHRGRVYVTWDETINFYDAVFPASSVRVSVENDDFFASANPFTVGALLRGTTSGSGDVDLFSFTASAGETFVMRTDSLADFVGLAARIICANDTSTINNFRFLAFNSNFAPALCWTAPVTGTYYLRITPNSSTFGAYVLTTTFDAANFGDRARANRDHFAAFSDDGTSWNAPQRLNDNAPTTDGIFPEVAVDDLGRVHCFWHDFRDDPACGALSVEYVTSSGDGGVTWGANRAMSDALSFWSINACGTANQGDYQGITAQGSRVVSCWSDSRLGDPDVWTDVTDHQVSLGCAGPVSLFAGSDTILTVSVINDGNVNETLGWNVSDSKGWITGVTPSASGSQSVPPGGGEAALGITLHAPGNCAGTPDTVVVVEANLLIPGESVACTLLVHCSGTVGIEPAVVEAGILFDAPRPNPNREGCEFGYSLARPGPVRLAIYSITGSTVRTLLDGVRPAGRSSLHWDGRDRRGKALPPGTYFARFEAEGRRIVRSVIRTR